MFMVIPTDSISENLLDEAFAPVSSDNVEPEVQSDLKNAALSECSLFHVQFRLNKQSHVIMPQARRTKPVQGTPKELMMKLKSLSETLIFDAYFRFDTYAQVELQKMSSNLPSLKTPTLNLTSMFDGRGGGLNLWSHQGLAIASELNGALIEREDGKKVNEQPRETSPPPPYIKATPPSPARDTVFTPSHDPRICPSPIPRDSAFVPETPPRDIEYWARLTEIANYRSPSLIVSQAHHKRKAVGEAIFPTEHVQSVHVASSARRGKQPRLHQSPVHASPIPITELQMAAEIPDTTVQALDRTHEAQSFDASDMFDGIVQWLYNAWTVLPRAHHDLRAELLAFGAATTKRAFNEARTECSMRLAFAVAQRRAQHQVVDAESTSSTAKFRFDAEEQVREVIRWIREVKSDADLYMIQSLVGLAEKAMAVVNAKASAQAAETERVFLLFKAQCIASACLMS